MDVHRSFAAGEWQAARAYAAAEGAAEIGAIAPVLSTVPEESSMTEGAETHETPAAPQQQQLRLDESKASACYANFCRVTGTPEELIVDFGLNSQPMGVPTDPIEIKQRLIINFFTAKRLLGALSMAV